ncbi:MAG: glycosyltransferase family 2 protein [Bacteroidales bacterium]|nr:glycosyltransferase family 2 protein [Bacteroidales bacterium]MDT8374228.1 glycosyltransferase family 2 protein [Bacteroidales bacterium]
MTPVIVVVIPAFNEENAIGEVLKEIPANVVSEIVVVDNNSEDDTADAASKNGATVLFENRQGYGYACLKGIGYFEKMDIKPDIIVFLDADHSDYPEELPSIVKPILENDCDLVIGSRKLGVREKGSMTPQQVFGNWLATSLIKIFYGIRFTDLGPFRAIKFDKLLQLQMADKTYGWTVEMQVKAAKMKMKCCEIPVNYRHRIGFSKVSGTLTGSMKAGFKILFTIFRNI